MSDATSGQKVEKENGHLLVADSLLVLFLFTRSAWAAVSGSKAFLVQISGVFKKGFI